MLCLEVEERNPGLSFIVFTEMIILFSEHLVVIVLECQYC